jgi:hypothetical protein
MVENCYRAYFGGQKVITGGPRNYGD